MGDRCGDRGETGLAIRGAIAVPVRPAAERRIPKRAIAIASIVSSWTVDVRSGICCLCVCVCVST